MNEPIEPTEPEDLPEGWEPSWDEVGQRGWQPTEMMHLRPPARPTEPAPPPESAPPAEEPPADKPG